MPTTAANGGAGARVRVDSDIDECLFLQQLDDDVTSNVLSFLGDPLDPAPLWHLESTCKTLKTLPLLIKASSDLAKCVCRVQRMEHDTDVMLRHPLADNDEGIGNHRVITFASGCRGSAWKRHSATFVMLLRVNKMRHLETLVINFDGMDDTTHEDMRSVFTECARGAAPRLECLELSSFMLRGVTSQTVADSLSSAIKLGAFAKLEVLFLDMIAKDWSPVMSSLHMLPVLSTLRMDMRSSTMGDSYAYDDQAMELLLKGKSLKELNCLILNYGIRVSVLRGLCDAIEKGVFPKLKCLKFEFDGGAFALPSYFTHLCRARGINIDDVEDLAW